MEAYYNLKVTNILQYTKQRNPASTDPWISKLWNPRMDIVAKSYNINQNATFWPILTSSMVNFHFMLNNILAVPDFLSS